MQPPVEQGNELVASDRVRFESDAQLGGFATRLRIGRDERELPGLAIDVSEDQPSSGPAVGDDAARTIRPAQAANFGAGAMGQPPASRARRVPVKCQRALGER